LMETKFYAEFIPESIVMELLSFQRFFEF